MVVAQCLFTSGNCAGGHSCSLNAALLGDGAQVEAHCMAAEVQQGGTAQVHLRFTGLRFDPAHVDVLHYDSASHLLLVVRRAEVLVYDGAKPDQAPQVRSRLPSAACTTDVRGGVR